MKMYRDVFAKIASLETLFSAWDEFKKDKREKRDVQQFEWRLEKNIFQLHRDLVDGTYRHCGYTPFYIRDPKQRLIHKASVRDRIVHHAVFSVLNPLFEPTFISASFSCRVGKGTHRAVALLEQWLRSVNANGPKPCFVLKCDIHQFFATVDHDILLCILCKRIRDEKAIWLLREIIESFVSPHSNLFTRKGLPIGNLTSQFFANIYLNEFDQHVKHVLKIKYFARYTDDFVIVAEDKHSLENLIASLRAFLETKLGLVLHSKKVTIYKYRQGVDFLGYVVLPHHRVLRTKTKRRIFKKLRKRIAEYRTGHVEEKTTEQGLQSYLGVLSHANTYRLRQELINQYWFLLKE